MCAASSHLKWSESNTNCPAQCCTLFFPCLSLLNPQKVYCYSYSPNMFASKGSSALTGFHYVTHSLRVPSVRTLSGYKAKIHVDPKASPKPSNVTGLKSFLGLLQYYSKFLPNLSVVLAQLYRLLHRGCEWKWAEPEEEALICRSRNVANSVTTACY